MAPPNARTVAFDALIRVDVDAAYLDRVLPAAFTRTQLSPEDRGLANELAYGVLRRRDFLDAVINKHRPVKKLDTMTLTALRLGAYQLVLLDRVPTHAAVSETVNVIKHRQKSSQGLVNAVLRRISEAPKPVDDGSGSLPEWIAKRFSDPDPTLPLRIATPVEDLTMAFAKPAHPSFRVLSQRLSRDALVQRLQAQGANAWALPHVPNGVGVERIGEVGTLEGFGHDFVAQDEAAQWVMELARGEKGPVLDACAAPGGKTIALWDLGLTPITAIEIQPNRKELLDKALLKAEIPATTRVGDAAKSGHGTFATIVVDAPCTGSGTLKRHPELRWRMSPDDVPRMAILQREILAGVLPQLQSGGALIYAVCSVFAEEGADHVPWLEAQGLRVESWLSTRSAMQSMDGFFAVKLRRP